MSSPAARGCRSAGPNETPPNPRPTAMTIAARRSEVPVNSSGNAFNSEGSDMDDTSLPEPERTDRGGYGPRRFRTPNPAPNWYAPPGPKLRPGGYYTRGPRGGARPVGRTSDRQECPSHHR